jgi:hypothetical protein
MRKSVPIALLMFCVPFVLLALSYRAAPSDLPVLRSWIGHTSLWAPKSLFMVFRVPVMNLIHGLMAAIMLSRASCFTNLERRTSYSNVFSTLLFTIALKADFEGLEFFAATSPALRPYESWIGYGTFTCLLVGLALAAIRGGKVKLPWPELRLRLLDKVALSALFAAYLAIVIASVAAGHRA